MRIAILLLLLFPFFLAAQSSNQTYVTAGIMQSYTSFTTYEKYEVIRSNGSTRTSGTQMRPGKSPGLSLGLSRKLHPRWEAAFRVNYTGATISDTIRLFNFVDFGLENSQVRDRRIRALGTEALVFWRVLGSRSLVDLQIGTGLAWMASSQAYDSGFTLNGDTGVYDYYYTSEKISDFGIPVHFQLQYPINYHFKIGGALQINSYFGRPRQQTNLTAFVAYRW